MNRTVDDDDDPKNFKSIRSIGIGVSVDRKDNADFKNQVRNYKKPKFEIN